MLELNLFYEQQQIQRDKDLDPVRLTIVGGSLLILAIGLWAGMIYVKMAPLRAELADARTKLEAAEKLYKGLGEIYKLDQIKDQCSALKNRMDNRALFSTQLDVFRDLIPTNCQLTAFTTTRNLKTINIEKEGNVPDPANEGKSKKGKIQVPHQVPVLELGLKITTSADTKLEVSQIGDNLKKLLQTAPRIHEWAVPDTDDSKSNTWNKVTEGPRINQDPIGKEKAVGIFDFRIPIALKDEPRQVQ